MINGFVDPVSKRQRRRISGRARAAEKQPHPPSDQDPMEAVPKTSTLEASHSDLLKLLVVGGSIPSDKFKELVLEVDHLDVIAKVFLLEGTPYVFAQSPMKYMVFREQVADRFQVGYQDVCVVGSAKLGFSPSPQKFGKVFAEESDVDVVIISDKLFDQGTLKLFEHLNRVGPSLHVFGHSENRSSKNSGKEKPEKASPVKADEWRAIKEGVRNYVYQNFNPALLPGRHDPRARSRARSPTRRARVPMPGKIRVMS